MNAMNADKRRNLSGGGSWSAPWDFAVAFLQQIGLPSTVVPNELTINTSLGIVVVPLAPRMDDEQFDRGSNGVTASPPACGPTFRPNPAQLRILAAISVKPKSSTQLRNLEPHLYDRPHGIHELVDRGLVKRGYTGQWLLTEEGKQLHERVVADQVSDEPKAVAKIA